MKALQIKVLGFWGLLRRFAMTGNIDSRFRENDRKRSGDDPSEARLHGASIKNMRVLYFF